VRVWTDNYLKSLAIFYASGLPDRMEDWKHGASPGLDSMTDGQILITDRQVQDGKLKPEFTVARYSVYRFREQMATDAYAAAISPKCLRCPSAPDSQLEIQVTVTNLSERRWIQNGISLSTRFVRTWDGVAVSGFDNRFPVGAIAPHESRRYTVPTKAPSQAGQYRLEVDLVHEMVAWFSSKGSRRGELTIEVGR
jgi:hypothetical protein